MNLNARLGLCRGPMSLAAFWIKEVFLVLRSYALRFPSPLLWGRSLGFPLTHQKSKTEEFISLK